MKKKSRSLLIIGALLGAVATGALIVNLLGDSDEDLRRTRRTEAADREREPTQRTGKRVVQRVTEADLRREHNKQYSSVLRPGERKRFDSPQTEADRTRMSLRVLEILETIRSDDPANRGKRQALMLELQKTVREMGRRLPRSTRDELVAMVDTVEPRWRRLIGATLAELRGDTETAQMVMLKLQGRPEDEYTRAALLIALTGMEVKEVLPDLTKMLGGSHEREDLIARAIGRIGGRDATDTLLKYLEKPAIDPTTAREIERILGAGGDPVVLAKVQKSLESASPEKRVSMLRVLGGARKKEYAESIRNLLESETDPSVKGAAISALGKIGDPESGMMLLELAQGSDPTTANRAINALQMVRDPAAVTAMVAKWDKLDDKARFAVMGAAARVPRPTKEMIQVARDSLYDDNERVRNKAALVLGRSRNDEYVEVLGSYMRGAKTSRERSVAIMSLERIGTAKAAEEGLRSVQSLPTQQQESVRLRFERILEKRRR